MDSKTVCCTKKNTVLKEKKNPVRPVMVKECSPFSGRQRGAKTKGAGCGKSSPSYEDKNNKTPNKAPQVNNNNSTAPFGVPPAHCCLFRSGQAAAATRQLWQSSEIKEREREKASLFSPPAPPPECPQTRGERSDTRDGQRRLPSLARSLARSPRSPGSRSIPERRGRAGRRAAPTPPSPPRAGPL